MKTHSFQKGKEYMRSSKREKKHIVTLRINPSRKIQTKISPLKRGGNLDNNKKKQEIVFLFFCS
jgi:hypothetical protein